VHSIRIEAVTDLLSQFPATYEKMKKEAKEKRAKHARKIASS